MAQDRLSLPRPGRPDRRHGPASLCETLPAARAAFRRGRRHPRLRPARRLRATGPAERLNSTVVSQPAIFVASLAALESLQAERAATPSTSASRRPGLSLGEYTALVFAGALSFRRRPARWCSGAARRCRRPPTPRPAAWSACSAWSRPRSRNCAPGARRRDCCRSPTCSVPATSSSPASKAACDAVERLAAEAGGRRRSGWPWPGRSTRR